MIKKIVFLAMAVVAVCSRLSEANQITYSINMPNNPLFQPFFQMMVKDVPGSIVNFTNSSSKDSNNIHALASLPIIPFTNQQGNSPQQEHFPILANTYVSTDFAVFYLPSDSPGGWVTANPSLITGVSPWHAQGGYCEGSTAHLYFQRPAQVYVPSTVNSSNSANGYSGLPITFPDYLAVFHSNLQKTVADAFVNVVNGTTGIPKSYTVSLPNFAASTLAPAVTYGEFFRVFADSWSNGELNFYTGNVTPNTTSFTLPTAALAPASQWATYYPVVRTFAANPASQCYYVDGKEGPSSDAGFGHANGSFTILPSNSLRSLVRGGLLYSVGLASGYSYSPKACFYGPADQGGLNFGQMIIPFVFQNGSQYLYADFLDFRDMAYWSGYPSGVQYGLSPMAAYAAPSPSGTWMLSFAPVIHAPSSAATSVVTNYTNQPVGDFLYGNFKGQTCPLTASALSITGESEAGAVTTLSNSLTYWEVIAQSLGPVYLGKNGKCLNSGSGIGFDTLQMAATQAQPQNGSAPLFVGNEYGFLDGATITGPVMSNVATTYTGGPQSASVPQAFLSALTTDSFMMGTYLQNPNSGQLPNQSISQGSWSGGLVNNQGEMAFQYYAGMQGLQTRGVRFTPYLPIYLADPGSKFAGLNSIGWNYCATAVFSNQGNQDPETCYEVTTSPMTDFSYALQGTRSASTSSSTQAPVINNIHRHGQVVQ